MPAGSGRREGEREGGRNREREGEREGERKRGREGEKKKSKTGFFCIFFSCTCMRHFTLSPGVVMTVIIVPDTMPATKCCWRLKKNIRKKGRGKEGGRGREEEEWWE